MKILVFSDSHLTDKFEEKKFNFLKKIIDQVDQVIINGDFWDAYLTTFNKFINSPWRSFFPILKKKNTVYVQGNHDKKIYSDKRVDLFSNYQTTSYKKIIGKTEYIFEHGNSILPAIDDIFNIKLSPIIQKPVKTIHDYLVQKFKKKFLKFAFKRHNQKMKKKIQKNLKNNQVYVCGHTHFAEIDRENQFMNSGIFRSGLGQYLIIEENKITLNEHWYD